MSQIDIIAAIQDLQIPSGPYAGGFENAPNGSMNWYFVNVGLSGMIPRLTRAQCETYVLPYLELYLENQTSSYVIQDVIFPLGRADPSNFTLEDSDSDDSYAATFFRLAKAYVQRTGNRNFIREHYAVMRNMALENHINNKKASGLVSTFQPPRRDAYDVGLFMDNCEVVQGLKALASMARWIGKDDSLYAEQAELITDALLDQFVESTKGFKWADINATTDTTFYPGSTCQIFPQAHGVTMPFRLHKEFRSPWAKGYAYLNRYWPNWETGAYDTFPWAILGYVAALRGQNAKAQALQTYIEGLFVSNRALVTINELGWYSLTQDWLTQHP